MDDTVNLTDKLSLFDESYGPRIVGYLNDYKLAVLKVLGELVWPKHDDTHDFFLVLQECSKARCASDACRFGFARDVRRGRTRHDGRDLGYAVGARLRAEESRGVAQGRTR